MKRFPATIIVAILAFFSADIACVAKDSKKVRTPQLPDTVSVVTQRAEAGDAKAQNTLGEWYHYGTFVKKDNMMAAKWFSESANQKDIEGIANLAECYQLGHGVKADSTMALKLYIKAIELGNNTIIQEQEKKASSNKDNLFSAQLLYQCYNRGIGVDKNIDKADFYNELLVERSSVERQYNLALDYINRQEYQKAIPWLKRAMRQNHIGATFYMGKLMFQGTGIEQDKETAIQLMEKAVESKFPGACLELGKIYLKGDGVDVDKEKGANYLKQIAGLSSEAGWYLGLCYLTGEGVEQNYFFALQWIAEYVGSHKKQYYKMLKEYPSFSEFLQGLKYYYIIHDYDSAMACFKKTEKDKRQEGTLMRGLCYAEKNYSRYNEKKAAKLVAKATKTIPQADYYLSLIFENGRGVKKDIEKSLNILQRAANNNIAEAQCMLGDKYMAGDVVPRDYVKAAKLYLEAEAQRHLSSQSAKNLAECYKKHVSILPDLDNSTKRIEKLSKQEDNNKLYDLLKSIGE